MIGAVFLSAGVPTGPDQPPANPYLIREAVSALVEVVLGRRLLVWGGHPGITPMIWAAAEGLGVKYADAVRLFQSRYFEDKYPEDNRRFDNVTYVEAVSGDLRLSLDRMRRTMVSACRYEAAVFIGGADGVGVEFEMFREANPRARLIPIASPGGWAERLFDRAGHLPEEMRSAVDYSFWLYELLDIRTTDPRDLNNPRRR